MPLSLSTEEMDLLLSLAAPIDHALRPQFLQEVAQELEVKDRPARSARARCIGWRARFSGTFRPACARRRASTGARSNERPRPHPVGFPRPNPIHRVRSLRPAGPLQRRPPGRKVRRYEIAGAAARARQLSEGAIAEHPRSLPGQVWGGQPPQLTLSAIGPPMS